MEEKPLKRLSINRKDLEQLTGKSERTCQRIMNKIREKFKLSPDHMVTFYHLSEHFGIPIKKLVPLSYK